MPDASGTGYNLVYSCSCYCTLWVFLEAAGREVTLRNLLKSQN